MTRSRILTVLGLLGICGIGLSVLMAAKGPGGADSPPPAPARPLQSLVCIGLVDTPDRVTPIFPENFPQPSRVVEVLVREGTDVKKGQPLLRLDTRMLDLKVQEAGDAIRAAQADQKRAQALVRGHKAQVDSLEKEWQAKQAELAAAQNEYKEAERLFNLKISVNQITLDEKKARVTAAELTLEAAKIKWEALKDEVPTYLVDLAREGVAKAQTMKQEAELARDQVACKAPADGRVIRSYASDGMTFGPQSREPAFLFLKDGPLLVRMEVTQEFAQRVRVGRAAEITDEADPDQRWTGSVTKVGEQFLTKRTGGASPFDVMPVNDDRVLECEVMIDKDGRPAPKFGQKVRVKLPD